MRQGLLTAAITLALFTAANATEDLTIDTKCNDTGCVTHVGPSAPGITVVPPVPRDSVLMCAGSRCFTTPALEHLPIEREYERRHR